MARVTLPERRQRVQAYTFLGEPFTTAFTRLMLGRQARLERLWEWDTLIPNVTDLPQKSHLAIFCTSFWCFIDGIIPPNSKQQKYISRFVREKQVFFAKL